MASVLDDPVQLIVVAIVLAACAGLIGLPIAMLVVHSYGQWGAFGRTIFGWSLFGQPWSVGFADAAKWLAKNKIAAVHNHQHPDHQT